MWYEVWNMTVMGVLFGFGVLSVIAIGVLLVRLLIGLTRRVKKLLFAKYFSVFQVHYNNRIGYRKQKWLKKGLQDLQDRKGRRSLDVIEIGAGSGANFEFIPPGIRVTCLEPNTNFEKHLRENAQRCPGVEVVRVVKGIAEDMSAIPSESFDAVISSLVLCSVDDVDKCLQEVLRVLKPGGQYFFFEHVSVDCIANDDNRSSLAYVRFLQTLLFLPWYYLFDCHFARKPHVNIQKAAFSSVHVEHFDAVEMVKPKPIFPFVGAVRPHSIGIATK